MVKREMQITQIEIPERHPRLVLERKLDFTGCHQYAKFRMLLVDSIPQLESSTFTL